MGYECSWGLEMKKYSESKEHLKAIAKVVKDRYSEHCYISDSDDMQYISADGLFSSYVIGPEFYLRLAMAAPTAKFKSESSCSYSVSAMPGSFEEVVFDNGILKYSVFNSDGYQGYDPIEMSELIDNAANALGIAPEEMTYEKFTAHYGLTEDKLPPDLYERLSADEEEDYDEEDEEDYEEYDDIEEDGDDDWGRIFHDNLSGDFLFRRVPDIYTFKISEDGHAFDENGNDITDAVNEWYASPVDTTCYF